MRKSDGIFKNFNLALNTNPPHYKSEFGTDMDFVTFMIDNPVVYRVVLKSVGNLSVLKINEKTEVREKI